MFVDLTLVGGVPRLLLCRETPLVRVFVDLTLVGGCLDSSYAGKPPGQSVC